MFVITAICGASAPIERSDSSPSTTSQPAPDAGVAAELRHDAADDPRRVAARLLQDERDHRGRRRLAVRAADDDRGLRGDELGQELGARDAVDPVQVGGRDDDLPAGRRTRLAAEVDLDPVERGDEDRVPSIPAAHLGAERAGDVRVGRHAGAADADEVQAPRLERARPALSGRRQARSALRRSGRRRRPAPSRASPPASRRGARGSASSSSTSAGTVPISASGTTIGSAAALEVPRVERLVVGGRVRVRDEDRRRPRGGELPDRAAGAGDGDVGRGEHVAEVIGLRHQHVARPRCTRGASAAKSRSPETCSTAGPRSAPGGDGHLVQRRRAGERAEDGDHRARRARARSGPAPSARLAPRCGDRDRPPDDLDLRARLGPGSRRRGRASTRTAPPAGSRGRGGRRPRSAPPGCRSGERRAPSGRRRSRRRRGRRRACRRRRIARQANGALPARQSARRSSSGRLPREAADRERVELEARLRNQPRLDAVGAAGERHGRSARAQRFPDRERGPDVTGGPSRRDHDYELRRLDHSRRC